MRRVGSRRKIGGKSLASGTDGCVFDVRFLPDGSIEQVDGIVSKVFPKEKKDVANNEYSILNSVIEIIPDGKGVVVGDTELKTVTAIKDTIGDKARIDFSVNACGRIVLQMQRGESPFYVLEYPRIDGSIIDLNLRGMEIAQFDDAIVALQTLSKAGLIHMDIAARNVFVKNNKCLIGDFGNMINIKDSANLEASVRGYITKYSIDTIGDCISDQGTSTTARIAMLMYVSNDLPALKTQMNRYLETYVDDNKKTVYEFADVYYEANHPMLETLLIENLAKFLKAMRTLETKSDIEKVMINELMLTDIRMLAMLMAERCKPSEELNAKVVELWKANNWLQLPAMLRFRLAALKAGSKRTRRKRVKMSRKHK